jgi:NADPH-dependent 2,4-dienoyl-CoA reductase/sulfur reductase-like enzyme
MSYTERVLSTIHNPELRKRLHRDEKGRERDSRVEWIKDDVNKFPRKPFDIDFGPDPSNGSLQQSDLLRKFYLTIAIYGLQYAYNHHLFGPGDLPGPKPPPDHVKGKKKVIIVGAGMSGLVAGLELKREGYDVELLELSQRYGGRVKTLTEKNGYDKGLHADCES